MVYWWEWELGQRREPRLCWRVPEGWAWLGLVGPPTEWGWELERVQPLGRMPLGEVEPEWLRLELQPSLRTILLAWQTG